MKQVEETARIKCPHCLLHIYFEENSSISWDFGGFESIEEKKNGFTQWTSPGYGISYGHCPACGKLIIYYQEGSRVSTIFDRTETLNGYLNAEREDIIYPKFANFTVAEEVPDEYKTDYIEAKSVLPISPKASAALSRRILQNVLREELGIKKRTLEQEIETFMQTEGVPSYLGEAVDAIRNIGNFAAHPMKNTHTGEIVSVEDGEAEWLLEVNEALFDYVFIQPKKLEERKNALNSKLSSLGKPPLKTKN